MAEPLDELEKRESTPEVSGLTLPSLKGKPKKFKIKVVSIVALIIFLLLGPTVWLGSLGWKKIQQRDEIKLIEAEKRERANAARVAAAAAAELAEAERLKKEAEAAAAAAEAERLKQMTIQQRQQEAERLAKARGGVAVQTEPSGATVTLAAEEVEKTPAKFESIKLGQHSIKIERAGYETIQREIEIREDVITNLGTIKLIRETGKVSVDSQPTGAMVAEQGKNIGVTPLHFNQVPTGTVRYSLKLRGYHSATVEGKAAVEEPLKLMVELEKRLGPAAGKAWQNDLGMKFNPVPGLKVLFSVYETTVENFEVFVKETGYNADERLRSLKDSDWGWHGHSWRNPGFEQGSNSPVVGVSWHDAKAFCAWLTERDRAAGVLSVGQSYRLPTDAEWSKAVGLRENESGTPEQKNGVAKWQYPWGTDWPPPREVGNYAGHEAGESNWPYGWQVMAEHRDKYPRTSPVGSFLPRVNGLYDMGGNVGEWCEDKYKADAMWRVLRGASWGTNKEEHLLSSHREYYGPNDRYSLFGFRCVVSYQ